MKMKRLNLICAAASALLMLASCEKFLDTLPDNRAEVNTEAKVTSLLVSAYPDHSPIVLMEMGTDNIADNGPLYNNGVSQKELYLWQDVSTESNDDPKGVWQAHYNAIASANQALQSISDLGNPSSLAPQKAEALLCRAYSMFILSNMFCLSYNPSSADKDLGLPYPTAPETTVDVKYERGTMNELYTKINDDIEAALPNISDDIYSVPKYHFNRKAAYAFAARFNLYYMKYDKVVKYATEALGNKPADVLRNLPAIMGLGRTDASNVYIDASNSANLLILPAYSLAARIITGTSSSYRRYHHNTYVASYETFWPKGPWGTAGSTNNFLYYSHKVYGQSYSDALPKIDEHFEYTDKTGGTGFAHIVDVPLTTNETLLCRAEAYIMKKEYDNALKDLNLWMQANCYPTITVSSKTQTLPTLTLDYLKTFYDAIPYATVPFTTDKERSIKKTLHPLGFTVEAGDQENLIQCLLHFRRIETLHTGQRWCDLKRYGIEFSHNVDGAEPVVFKTGDLRGAIQLPSDVITAGLTANPR
jgi:hypothetical protein